MNVSEFLNSFISSEFPDEFGPWLSVTSYSFTRTQLREARKRKLVQLSEKTGEFRLTYEALLKRQLLLKKAA